MRRRHRPVHLRDLDWYKFVRRYFWDDETTPYLVPVTRLHRRQADHEIFAYCLFLILLFTVVTLASITGKAPYGRSFPASLFGLCIACSALLLGTTKHLYSALVCAAAPVGMLAYSLAFNLHSEMELLDRTILIALSLVWLRYSLRVIHIAKAYPLMPEPPPGPPPG